jgi:hypothetical protein
MRRTTATGAAALLMLGLAAASAPAQEADGDYHSAPPPRVNWLSGWFGWGGAPAYRKPPAPPAEGPAAKPTPVEAARVETEQEWKALWRRVDACARLMEIAHQNNDEALARRAEEMSARAFEIYNQRTSRLAGAPAFTSDEAALDKRLSGGGPNLLAPPGQGGPDGRAVNLRGDK